MNEKLLSIILAVVVLICVIGLGLLYWFEYRPSDIRDLCTEEARVNARPKPPWDQTKRRARSYDECLHENGLDK